MYSRRSAVQISSCLYKTLIYKYIYISNDQPNATESSNTTVYIEFRLGIWAMLAPNDSVFHFGEQVSENQNKLVGKSRASFIREKVSADCFY
jgi:hypothetical protein